MAQAEPESVDRDELLGDAIEAYLELAESGSAPEPDEFAEKYPDIADELREALDGLALVQGLVGDSGGGGRPLSAGRRVAGYRIVRELGRGGMGVVYEAVHVDLDRPVALKVLGMHAAPDSTGRRRFLNEAKTAASLHHTHIVPVFDVGQVGGLCYYAMQRIEGAGLDRVVKSLRRDRTTSAGSSLARRSRLRAAAPPTPDALAHSVECLPVDPADRTASFDDWSDAGDLPGLRGTRQTHASPYTPPRGSAYYRWVAQVGAQASEALAYAHRRGVVHRDVKPSNLLVDGRGNIWVADFGLARKLQDDPGLTHSGVPIGTPRYMSPEQATSAPLDARTDTYSLGATLYELLTLRPPFDGKATPELVQQITNKEPVPPRKIDGRIPRDLETIVLKAMAKRPGDRYESTRELAEDITRFLNLEPVQARRIGPAGRAWRFARRHPYSSTISLVAASLMIAVATWAHLSVVRERNDAVAANQKAVRALQQAERAKRQADIASADALWRTATVTRGTRNPDRRTLGREYLGKAAKLAPDREMLVRLRDEAIELLALRDVEARAVLPTKRISGAAFTPDAAALATLVRADGPRIELIDPQKGGTNRQIPLALTSFDRAAEARRGGPMPRFPGSRHELAVLGNTALVVNADGNGVQFVDLNTGETRNFPMPGRLVDGVFASGNSNRFVVSEVIISGESDTRGPGRRPNGIRFTLWDVNRPDEPIATLINATWETMGRFWFPKLAISPDGDTIAIVANQGGEMGPMGGANNEQSAEITLYDSSDGSTRAQIDRIAGTVTAVAIGPDDQVVAALQSGELRIWDGNQTLKPGIAHDMFVNMMRLSPSGLVLAVTGWNAPNVQLYDLSTNSPIATVRAASAVQDILFSADSHRIAAVCGDNTTMWEIVDAVGRTHMSDSRPSSVAFSREGTLIIGGWEGPMRAWHPSDCPSRAKTLSLPPSPFVTSDDEGRLITVSQDAVTRWRYGEPESIESIRFPSDPRRNPAFETAWRAPGAGPSSGLGAANSAAKPRPQFEQVARALNLGPVRRPTMPFGRMPGVRVLGRSDQGRLITIARGEDLYVLARDLEPPLLRIKFEQPSGRGYRWGFLRSVLVTPGLDSLVLLESDGRSNDGRLHICELEVSGGVAHARVIRTSRFDNVSSLALSPDGTQLAMGSTDGTVRLIDCDNGTQLASLQPSDPEPHGEATALAFGHDGLLAVGAQSGVIALWDVRDPRRVAPILHLPGHTSSVHAIVFQADARAIASFGGDNVVQVWNLETVRSELGRLGLSW